MGLNTLQGYEEANLVLLIDPESSDKIRQAIIGLVQKGMAIIAEGKKPGNTPAVVAFASYFGGAGVMDGYNYAILNAPARRRPAAAAQVLE